MLQDILTLYAFNIQSSLLKSYSRYLVVIDDLWSTKAWKTIRDALPDNDHRSRIITSTRNHTVASCCCLQGDYIYKMKPLSFSESRKLFLERAFGSEDLCYPHLKEVCNKILEKCAGLPLAIISISSLLADEPAREEWDRALAAMGSSLEVEAGDMTKILSLSYFDLPHPMRTCLLYLSAYPEDRVIEKWSLIQKWIAEGFIHERQGWSTYQVGEYYFNELINRNLIKPANLEDKEEYGQVLACQVHDIILDFITCKAKEENFMTSFGDAEQGKTHRVRRLSLVSRNNDEMATVSGDLSHIRSLAMFGYLPQHSASDFPALGLLDFPALCVLDLGECEDLENFHLGNVEKLLLLKYLRLGSRSDSITELPEGIGKLKYLETLDVRRLRVGKLPSTMTRLQRLVRLYGGFGPTCLWNGTIGQLQSLEELTDVEILETEVGKFLQELSQLTKLRTLSVCVQRMKKEDAARFAGTLISSHNIHHLSIRQDHLNGILLGQCRYPATFGAFRQTRYGNFYIDPELLSLESWCPSNPSAFRKMCIPDYYIDKVPNWMSLLVNLRGLELCVCRIGPEDVAILGGIPALGFLKLETFYGRNGRILVRGFRSLKYFKLIVKYCGTAVEFQEGSMAKLEVLELDIKAHEVTCVNYASDFGIQHLSALTKVDLTIYGYSGFTDEIRRLIKTALGKLGNRPTLSYFDVADLCDHFETAVSHLSELLALILLHCICSIHLAYYWPAIYFSDNFLSLCCFGLNLFSFNLFCLGSSNKLRKMPRLPFLIGYSNILMKMLCRA
ncbi:hypothetical protein CFC21_055068 [Triticum aestivum]|uniref:Uncharacterized protein n=2 Tax=Triticum aestivum TaxID=4565 RepID=A0A3B6I1F4_WHEAT|nr:hypothetical protein CFC21_055068 [Triticum aestivum]